MVPLVINKFIEDRMINFSKFIPKNNKLAVITKIDTISKPKLLPMTARLHELGFENILYFSIKEEECIKDFKNYIKKKAVEGEWDFPDNIHTDTSRDGLIKEATKEVLFNKLYQELPYKIVIKNGDININPQGEYVVYQFLEVKKHAHHILLGRIKEISMAAAKNMEVYLKVKKVHLYLGIIENK
jgi:GTPase Era involved in 16S rRNA processing